MSGAVGDVLNVASDAELDGWLEMDGSELNTWEFPEFALVMGIRESTFTLPAPLQIQDGRKFVIKVGKTRGNR